MTHDIHVVAGVDDVVDEHRLIAGLIAAGWQAPAGASGLSYANPDTGVTASLEALTPALPARYRALDLGLVLNYVRASWFAVETIPGFAAAVASAGALVLDPQADRPTVQPPDSDRLISSWTRGNEAAVATARVTGATLPWLAAEASVAWWRYQRALPTLKRGFAAELYVPSIRLVRRTATDRVERAMSWPDYVPTLMPECDLIILLRSNPVGSFTITGTASASIVRERLDGITERAQLDVPEPLELILLRSDRAASAEERLAPVSLGAFEGFEPVAPAAFVDLPPSAE